MSKGLQWTRPSWWKPDADGNPGQPPAVMRGLGESKFPSAAATYEATPERQAERAREEKQKKEGLAAVRQERERQEKVAAGVLEGDGAGGGGGDGGQGSGMAASAGEAKGPIRAAGDSLGAGRAVRNIGSAGQGAGGGSAAAAAGGGGGVIAAVRTSLDDPSAGAPSLSLRLFGSDKSTELFNTLAEELNSDNAYVVEVKLRRLDGGGEITLRLDQPEPLDGWDDWAESGQFELFVEMEQAGDDGRPRGPAVIGGKKRGGARASQAAESVAGGGAGVGVFVDKYAGMSDIEIMLIEEAEAEEAEVQAAFERGDRSWVGEIWAPRASASDSGDFFDSEAVFKKVKRVYLAVAPAPHNPCHAPPAAQPLEAESHSALVAPATTRLPRSTMPIFCLRAAL